MKAYRRMKAIKENSILSFEAAGKFAVDFVKLDVQVTRDDCPVIFHDIFFPTEEGSSISGKRITDFTLSEFLCHGPQREPGNVGKSLLRKDKDVSWKVEDDDPLCTLEEAFQRVNLPLGFNIELKFDDGVGYDKNKLEHFIKTILQMVFEYAKERPIIFSSFQPDAVQRLRELQSVYPVYFRTNGGCKVHEDVRRNSIDEAIKLCLEGGLQGIVSEVRSIFRNPGAIPRIKEANLLLLTYGQLNNVSEAVYMQHLMGVDGVIVNLVKEIIESVSDFIIPAEEAEESGQGKLTRITRPRFSQRELSFLLKLIPELIQFEPTHSTMKKVC